MKRSLGVLWRLAVATLLYPLAFAAMIWIWWTGRSVWLGIVVLVIVLFFDRTWLLILRGLKRNERHRR